MLPQSPRQNDDSNFPDLHAFETFNVTFNSDSGKSTLVRLLLKKLNMQNELNFDFLQQNKQNAYFDTFQGQAAIASKITRHGPLVPRLLFFYML